MAAGGAGASTYTDTECISRGGDLQEEFMTRPNFVRREELTNRYSCKLCNDILIDPQQTPCGSRVCRPCISVLFGREREICCPLPHDDLTEEELAEEGCQQIGGLHLISVVNDVAIQRILVNERCFCPNQAYGCIENPAWKKLKDHSSKCRYKPEACTNNGCTAVLARCYMHQHVEECQFAIEPCRFCGILTKRIGMEGHYNVCDKVEVQCDKCLSIFPAYARLRIHQHTHPACIDTAGRCYYYDYCQVETSTVEQLRNHMVQDKDLHLEALTFRARELEDNSKKLEQEHTREVQRLVKEKVKSIEKVTADIAMNITKLDERLRAASIGGDRLMDAMRGNAHATYAAEQMFATITNAETVLGGAGIERIQDLARHTARLKDNDERLKQLNSDIANTSAATYDGLYIWKISNYGARKAKAINGDPYSIYTRPFYTSTEGYKVAGRAYLNGDGKSRGKHLSLYFVLMKGRYDALLEFPFKHQVHISLLSPRTPENSIHKTIVPHPSSPSFSRPVDEMNVAYGIPDFAPHTEVESARFLVDDRIYIRIRIDLTT